MCSGVLSASSFLFYFVGVVGIRYLAWFLNLIAGLNVMLEIRLTPCLSMQLSPVVHSLASLFPSMTGVMILPET